MLRYLFMFLVVVLGLQSSVGVVLAQEGFTTYLTATYTVDEAGETTVVKKFEITNNTSLHYISDYHITLGSTNISNIVAYSADEPVIKTTTSKGDNNTTISLDFQKPIVGEGNTHTFSLEYRNEDITQKVGRVLEVNIPKLSDTKGIDRYNIVLLVPREFGSPTTIAPQTKRISTDPAFTRLEYAHKQTTNESVSVIFGDYQLFDLSLRYNLENPTITPIITQIALPPDTPYQRMFYHQIQPLPQSIDLDADGNWIATYQLEPRVKTAVTVRASVQTFLEPTVPVRGSVVDHKEYLLPKPYWPTDDPQIQTLSLELGTAEKIYNYLVENLDYNYRRVDNAGTSRLGAKEILINPKNALCLEFADAFIALARAAGIPSRLNTGYAYTQNELLRPRSMLQEVLHAWPEYYDQASDRWIPVDPTWGSTTGGVDYFNQLDFNHIVFAVHGLDSERPYPAGYYKSELSQSRDVLVSYNQTPPELDREIEMLVNKTLWGKLGFSKILMLDIVNKSNVALHQVPVVAVLNGEVLGANPERLTILPFSREQTRLQLPRLLSRIESGRLVVDMDGVESSLIIEETNYGFIGIFIGGVIGGIIGLIILRRAKKAGSLLV